MNTRRQGSVYRITTNPPKKSVGNSYPSAQRISSCHRPRLFSIEKECRRHISCRLSETPYRHRLQHPTRKKSVGDTQPVETPPLRSVAELGGVKKRIITRLGRRPYTATRVQGLQPIPLHSTTLTPPNFAPLRKGGTISGEASPMLLNLTSSCIMPIGRTAYQVNPVSSSSIPYRAQSS